MYGQEIMKSKTVVTQDCITFSGCRLNWSGDSEGLGLEVYGLGGPKSRPMHF